MTTTTASIYKNSKLTSYQGIKDLLNGDASSVVAKLNQDAGYQLVKSMADAYNKKCSSKI